MRNLVALNCLLSVLLPATLAFADTDMECKSIIRQRDSMYTGAGLPVLQGPYFKKNQRGVGFVDEELYRGLGFFGVRGSDKPQEFFIEVKYAQAAFNGHDVGVLVYHPTERDRFPPELQIEQLVVFCSRDSQKLDERMSNHLTYYNRILQPFSERLK